MEENKQQPAIKKPLKKEVLDVDLKEPSALLEGYARREGLSPVFFAKVEVINKAIAEIGMGRYQYKLFVATGMGWFQDNLWLQAVAILMPAQANQTGWPSYPDIRLSTLALYVGLVVGSLFWGMTADVVGRRVAWNCTLVIAGIFGIAAGAAPNFASFGTFIAILGFGVGGNLPVDGALFLEFLPGRRQYLLTLLSAWWAFGQVVASLISWAFLARWSCSNPGLTKGSPGYVCDDTNNQGWRYSYYTLGVLMLFLAGVRAFVIPLDESPKFLMSIGQDHEAVAVIHRIAKANGKETKLSVADLHDAAVPYFSFEEAGRDQFNTRLSTYGLVRTATQRMDLDHIKALFATKRLAWSTSLIMFIYGALGLAYPLFNAFLGTYLTERQAEVGNQTIYSTYSTYTYQAACGVAGSIGAAALVQWSRGGRRFAMAFFTIMSGVFLFGLTTARSNDAIIVWTCMAATFENAFYGVLYGYAPEVFPTPSRATGDALAAGASRVTGLFAPIIAVYSAAAKTPNGPVYASAAIFIVTGLSMLGLPIETVGTTAL
ncbi:MFS domain-containing protein [Pseudohyphozyma bogoriensis]|nr:MFS domain-containing protein [Pseudohyphozyma bogoriensis]